MKTQVKEPIKRPPLHAVLQKQGVTMTMVAGWQVAAQFSHSDRELAAANTAVALADQSAMGRVAIQGVHADAVIHSAYGVAGLAIGGATAVDKMLICRLRHDMLLLTLPVGAEVDVVAKLDEAAEAVDSLVTVSNVTNGRFQFQIIGPQTAVLLGRLCGLDFHDSAFPNMSVKQSSVAKTRQTIIRQDIGTLPAYFLIGAGSFGQYVWETILEAGENLSIQPIGHDTMTTLSSSA